MKQHDWLTLQKEFFKKAPVGALDRIAGGDVVTNIYLKMVMLAVKTGGKIEIRGGDFFTKLADELDEVAGNVKMAVRYLQECGLAQRMDSVIWLSQAERLSRGAWRIGA